MSDPLTVIARITARPGAATDLLAALRGDARDTLAREPGCTGFEILVRDGDPDAFVLLETYRDGEAFEAHKAQPHFAAFEAAVERYAATAPAISTFHAAD